MAEASNCGESQTHWASEPLALGTHFPLKSGECQLQYLSQDRMIHNLYSLYLNCKSKSVETENYFKVLPH